MKINEDTIVEIASNVIREIVEQGYAGFDDNDETPNLSDLLSDCGWAYCSVKDMPDGRVAYRCCEDSRNAMSWDEVKNAVSSVFGDKASFGSATHRYAPEQKYNVVYIRYDNDEEEF